MSRAMSAEYPFLVPEGWSESVLCSGATESVRVLFYPNGEARFEHRCKRAGDCVVVCAPLIGGGHIIERGEKLTIHPSIACPDCGVHGYVSDGRWVEIGSAV